MSSHSPAALRHVLIRLRPKQIPPDERFAHHADMHTRFLPALLGLVSPVLFASVAPDSSTPLLTPAAPLSFAKACSADTDPVEAASACNALGILDLRAGDAKAGAAKFRLAIDLATVALGDLHPDVALYEANLALALALGKQFSRAEVLLHRARYIVDATLPSGDERLATVLAELSAVETAEKQFARAESDARQSLAIVALHNEPESLNVAVQQLVLATVYLREKKIAEAEAILPETVALERRLTADSPSVDRRILAHAVRRLGELRALQHNWREAQALYGEAIGIYEATSGATHPALAPILLEYAEVLKHSGVPKEQVRSVEARAKAIRTVKA